MNKNGLDPNSFISNPGDQYRTLYSPNVLADGTIELKVSGKEDIQQYIDSFKDQTDMNYILSHIASGDMSVLNKGQPFYGDFTELPKTYAEVLQLVIDSERAFSELPLDVRNSFDNDFKKWLAQSDTEEWYKKMDSVINPRPSGFPADAPIIDPDKPIDKEVSSE